MPGWNGSGTFERYHDWTTDQAANVDPSATRFDQEDDNFATGLNNCLTRDGQNSPSGDLPMGGYKHTNVDDAAARTSYASAGQVQDNALCYLTSVSGADTITAALASPTLAAYAAGQRFEFVSAGANTGAVTLNINSLGAKAVTKEGTTALAAGDIASGAVVQVVYDGTRFQLSGGRTHAAALDLSDYVQGPASATDANIVTFDGTGGKTIQDSGTAFADLTLNTATDVSGNSWVVDEDDLSSDLDTKVPTQQSVKAYADGLGAGYRTAELTLLDPYAVSSASGNVAHGLGGVPQIVQVFLYCKTTEEGYAAGAYLPLAAHAGSDGAKASIAVDATNINAFTGSVLPYVINATSNTNAQLTASNWKLVARCVYFG